MYGMLKRAGFGRMLLSSALQGGGLGGAVGGLYGAFRKKDPGESRLGAIGRSALTGAGTGAAITGGGTAAMGATKWGRRALPKLLAMKRKPGLHDTVVRSLVKQTGGDTLAAMHNLEALKGRGILGMGVGGLGAYGLLRRKSKPEESNPEEPKAAHFLRPLVKRAEEGEEDAPRGAGQRLFEGTYGGAGKGMIGGSLLGALLGGYGGYRATSDKDDLKTKLKAILAGAGIGGIGGGALGTGVGGLVGGVGSTFLGSRKQKPTF